MPEQGSSIPLDEALKRLLDAPPAHRKREKDEREPDEDDVIEPHEDESKC